MKYKMSKELENALSKDDLRGKIIKPTDTFAYRIMEACSCNYPKNEVIYIDTYPGARYFYNVFKTAVDTTIQSALSKNFPLSLAAFACAIGDDDILAS